MGLRKTVWKKKKKFKRPKQNKKSKKKQKKLLKKKNKLLWKRNLPKNLSALKKRDKLRKRDEKKKRRIIHLKLREDLIFLPKNQRKRQQSPPPRLPRLKRGKLQLKKNLHLDLP